MFTKAFWLIVVIFAIQIATFFWLGQPGICECGFVKFWEGEIFSIGNSQHIADWYTFSHIIHGFLFYALARFLFPKRSTALWLVLAVLAEVSWEIFENTPMVINHYRQQALAVGYTGDSVLNSVCDVLWMMFGFAIAYKVPVKVSIAIVIALELFVLYSIRDNLTLNIINLIYPFEFISKWQSS
ncbi:MAG: DUF2585 family protein [Patescibacteria group bacterium]